jgi:8-oxo-dGTP pyrophosphatase MutT (NUDIX family)
MAIAELMKRYFGHFPHESDVREACCVHWGAAELLDRSVLPGHVTASAMIVDRAGASAALVFHQKLQKWLQPGGHADGVGDLSGVAMREAVEETGLVRLRLADTEVFDFGLTPIPEFDAMRAHVHYDLRFLIWGDSAEEPTPSDETPAVKWVLLDRLEEFTRDSGILRMRAKYLALCSSTSDKM